MAAEQGGSTVGMLCLAFQLHNDWGGEGVSPTLVSGPGMHSPIPPCARVNSHSVHNTSRTHLAENKAFAQVSSLQQAYFSAPAHSTATLALVLAKGM